ncbi:efflux RND transporter permease subunit [Candidatus Laterigemmans baculatus]|uniref:efflux RND transporter permease subunit n=1 Tax=Candidatus Laterigemmans baculatus TaxID=2770505 RepID=UPI0013DB61A7|nr:MMPL family transporter [Candidatus Laterigemmans baculatus]
MASRTASRAAAFLIAGRWWLLAVAVVALGLAFGPAMRLDFDRRIEQMFPRSDPSVESYELLRSRFGGNAVAMLVYRDPQLFSPEGLARARATAAEAAEVPGVFGVLSLAQVNDALASTRPAGILGFGGASEAPAILGDDRLAEGFRELFADYTHDREGDFAAVVAMLDPAHPERHGDAVAELRRIASGLPAVHRPLALVGEPVLMAEGFELVEEDGHRLSTTTVILLALTTLLMFRSLRWVIAELAVIGWAVVLTRAAAVAWGLQLTMVSSMLTAIVTVIAVASVIHIANRFRIRRRRGDAPEAAAHAALAAVLPPVFWACLTDAAGFAALVVSQVGPVREFGLMMTLGAAMVLLGILLILPALMLLPPHPAWAPAGRVDRAIGRSLVRLLVWLDRRRRFVTVVTLLIGIGTGVGLVRLQTETNFIRNFRATSDLAQGYAMVESQFGGAGVWDVVLPAPRQLSAEYLASVRELEERLRQIEIDAPHSPAGASPAGEGAVAARLTKVLSMAGAEETAASAPLLALATPTVRIAGMRAAIPAFVDALLTPPEEGQPRYLRIMLRSPERLPAAEKLALIAAVSDEVDAHTSTDQWRQLLAASPSSGANAGEASGDESSGLGEIETRGRVTGYYVLLARLIENLLRDQWLCLAIAAAAVFVMMAVATGSLRLAAICMLPNALPVLAVLGILGLLGIRVNMGAAMIAAVSIGLTVDGSIHFVFSYLAARERAASGRGASSLRAVQYAQSRIGLPVLLATIALALGFSILSTSEFIPTVTFGVLVTAALAAGTAANLTLLPLLLIHLVPRSSRPAGER